MASIPCTIQLATTTLSGWRSPRAARGGLLVGGGGAAWLRPSLLSLSKVAPPARESGRVGFFKFGNKDAEGAGIYGSQGRDDFDRDDVEQVTNKPLPSTQLSPPALDRSASHLTRMAVTRSTSTTWGC